MQVVQKRCVRHQSSEGASFQRCWMRPLAGPQWANIHPLHPCISSTPCSSSILSQADLGSEVPTLPLESGHRDGGSLHSSKEPDGPQTLEGVLGRASAGGPISLDTRKRHLRAFVDVAPVSKLCLCLEQRTSRKVLRACCLPFQAYNIPLWTL